MNINDLNYLINCIANILDIVSYISTDVLMLRIVLIGASALFIWSAIIVPDKESIFFNVIYLLINFCQACYLLWMMRPIEFEDEDIENVYNKIFAPPLTAMSKLDFQLLVENGYLRRMEKGLSYSEDGNLVDQLSILISGKIDCVRYEVDKYGKKKEKVVNSIESFEFIESPQWLTRRQDFDQTFVGRMRAGEDCHYLTWKLDELDVLISHYPQYKSFIDAVVGSDVARKILKMDANIEELSDEPIHTHAHEPPPANDPFKLNPAITAAYNKEYGIEPEAPPVTVDQGMSQNRSLIFGGSVHRRHGHKVPSRQPSIAVDHHQHHHQEQHVHVSLGRSVHMRRTIGDMLSGSVHNRGGGGGGAIGAGVAGTGGTKLADALSGSVHNRGGSGTSRTGGDHNFGASVHNRRGSGGHHVAPSSLASMLHSIASLSSDTGHSSKHETPPLSRQSSNGRQDTPPISRHGSSSDILELNVLSPLRSLSHSNSGYQAIPRNDSPTPSSAVKDGIAADTSRHMELTTGDADGGITEPSDHHMYVVNEDAESGSEDY